VAPVAQILVVVVVVVATIVPHLDQLPEVLADLV
jgi:hypothetical protein